MATLITYIRFDRRNASNSGRGMGLFCKFFLALGLLFTLAGCKQPIPLQESQDSDDGSFVICSFNIQFLGSRKLRDNEALAQLLAENNCAAVVIQELVAPPDVRELRASQYYGQAEMPVYPGTEKNGTQALWLTIFLNKWKRWALIVLLCPLIKLVPMNVTQRIQRRLNGL